MYQYQIPLRIGTEGFDEYWCIVSIGIEGIGFDSTGNSIEVLVGADIHEEIS